MLTQAMQSNNSPGKESTKSQIREKFIGMVNNKDKRKAKMIYEVIKQVHEHNNQKKQQQNAGGAVKDSPHSMKPQ